MAVNRCRDFYRASINGRICLRCQCLSPGVGLLPYGLCRGSALTDLIGHDLTFRTLHRPQPMFHTLHTSQRLIRPSSHKWNITRVPWRVRDIAPGGRNRVLNPLCLCPFDSFFDTIGLQFDSINCICSTAVLVKFPVVQGSSGQTATLTTSRSVRLSYFSLVSAPIPPRILL